MAELPPGTIIGERYRVVGLLGSGGFGTVYEAQHIHMSRAVALKVLDVPSDKPDHAEICKRFIQEAEAAARIDHPGVVTVYDLGFTGSDRQPFIAMKRLEGRDLEEDLLRHGGMDPSRALPLFVDCLDALGQAHKEGIIHKDLKPGNLFLMHPEARSERLCIVDFGMACIMESDTTRITTTGQFLGTPKYVAPEYVRQQTASPALDVYQMALILVEMLTGEPVVEADHVYACIMMHCSGDLKLPVSVLDSPLGPVLERALAFDNTQRYPDAHAFRDALEAIDPATVPLDSFTSPKRSLAPLAGKVAPLDLGEFSQDLDAELGSHDTWDSEEPVSVVPAGLKVNTTRRIDAEPVGAVSLEMQRDIQDKRRLQGLFAAVLAFVVLVSVGVWALVQPTGDEDAKNIPSAGQDSTPKALGEAPKGGALSTSVPSEAVADPQPTVDPGLEPVAEKAPVPEPQPEAEPPKPEVEKTTPRKDVTPKRHDWKKINARKAEAKKADAKKANPPPDKAPPKTDDTPKKPELKIAN